MNNLGEIIKYNLLPKLQDTIWNKIALSDSIKTSIRIGNVVDANIIPIQNWLIGLIFNGFPGYKKPISEQFESAWNNL